MKTGRISRYFGFGAGATGLGLLLFIVGQINAMEKRLTAQNTQLRALGENTERITTELKRLASGAAPSAAQDDGCRIDKPLHPEVPNFLSAADTHWPPPGAALNGTLKRGWKTGDPKGFNWLVENSADLGELLRPYTDQQLASMNAWTDPNRWYGDLACRLEVTDDFKEYTFYLRRGVTWHEPSGVDLNDPKYAWLKGEHPVTAHDFVFTLDLLMNPQVENGFLKNYYADLESWRAIDDHTLVVRWKKRIYGSVTQTLSLAAMPEFLYAFSEEGERYPKELLGTKFNHHWYNHKGLVGSGSYRFAKYTPGNSIQLTRNQDFLGEKPAIQQIQYAIYTDPSQTALRMKAKEITFEVLTPSSYRDEVKQWENRPISERPKNSPFLDGKISCQVVPDTSYSFIGWNSSRPQFTDPKVRTAMTLAFRRGEIVEKVFSGLGEVISGPFLPETGNLDPDVDPLAFDPARAKRLLSEADWKDTDGDGVLDKLINGVKTRFEFSLLIYANRPEVTALANIYKDDLLNLGVRMKIESAEWALMQKRMDERNFDAFTGGWSLPWENDPYQTWHSSQADVPKGSNRVGFRSKEADALIEELRTTFDPAKRQQMFRRVHRLIYEAQPYTFFYRRSLPFCASQDVRGLVFAKVRPISDSRPWFVSEAL